MGSKWGWDDAKGNTNHEEGVVPTGCPGTQRNMFSHKWRRRVRDSAEAEPRGGAGLNGRGLLTLGEVVNQADSNREEEEFPTRGAYVPSAEFCTASSTKTLFSRGF